MELLDIFYLWSVPYMIVDGSLLNLYRWAIVDQLSIYLCRMRLTIKEAEKRITSDQYTACKT